MSDSIVQPIEINIHEEDEVKFTQFLRSINFKPLTPLEFIKIFK